jgi:trehalose synthase
MTIPTETEGQQPGLTLDEYSPEISRSPDDYEPYIGRSAVEALKRLADPVREKGWDNVSSTFAGGGVAEILRSAIPLARGLGLDARWHVIRGQDGFFEVTKKFHNMLHGLDASISLEEIFEAYLDTIDENARNTFISSDLVVVHDPQPAALIMNGVIYGNILWRCHIDTSAPNKIVWRFLLPYINQCAGAIFSMPEFVGPGVQVPVYQITPCIDPLAEKNRQYSSSEALEILAPLFREHDVDPERPILAAVSRYDTLKNQGTIIQAFKRLRERNSLDPAPYLIFLGNTAIDDPEGGVTLERLRALAGDDPDIKFWANVDDNDRVVGSLMRVARACIHVSTREGFGLVVSEALWQGTPVIGSRAGGITRQVIDGETGHLVDPMDVDAIAARISALMEAPDDAERMGARGREHVRASFLLPELVRRYVLLIRFFTGVDHEPPPFRLNGVTYREVIGAGACRWLPTDLDRT